MMSDPLIILASASPRRKFLLEQAGLSFSVIPASIDENAFSHLSPKRFVRVLAEQKADRISEHYPESWIIGADTIVLINGLVLGKPASRREAKTMLSRLSGKTHTVLTGYAVCCRNKKRRFSDTVQTRVKFKELSNKEIEWYLDTREPYDKAGAYAIQELGTRLVRRISGSYTNVVGLPVCEVMDILIRERIVSLRTP
jgi:septum formation protein